MHNYKELEIWKRSLELAVEIYKLTEKFPDEEKFGLITQLRKSAVSILSNIAEGAGRNTRGEFSHFLGISTGSLFELETQSIISEKVGFLEKNISLEISDEVSQIARMIYGFQNSIKKS